MSVQQLPLPPHFDEGQKHDSEYHTQNIFWLQNQAMQWANKHNIAPSIADRVRIHLLIIDQQHDFSFLNGSLFVAGQSGTGAEDDSARLARFIYWYLHIIGEATCTMDSHLPHQVFFPSAHLLSDGSHPEPFTIITEEDYRSGKYRANPQMAAQLGVDQAWLTRQFTHYTSELKKGDKLSLTLWPYHCLIGNHGHKLAGLVEDARLFHSFARGAKNHPAIKGGNPLTEHYSIFQPEVTTLFNGQPIPGVQKNTQLLETLLRSNYVIIAGEAGSHCLAWTIKDLLKHILAVDPSLAKKVYILRDCTSPVVVRDPATGVVIVDYTNVQEEAFDEFQNAGMHLVNSTDPIDTWPGFRL